MEIEQQQGNQAVLEAMNDRQGLQLKLQSTVEGLSMAAITYYIVGLIGYLAKGAKVLGWPLTAENTTVLSILLVALGVWWFICRITSGWPGTLTTTRGADQKRQASCHFRISRPVNSLHLGKARHLMSAVHAPSQCSRRSAVFKAG